MLFIHGTGRIDRAINAQARKSRQAHSSVRRALPACGLLICLRLSVCLVCLLAPLLSPSVVALFVFLLGLEVRSFVLSCLVLFTSISSLSLSLLSPLPFLHFLLYFHFLAFLSLLSRPPSILFFFLFPFTSLSLSSFLSSCPYFIFFISTSSS